MKFNTEIFTGGGNTAGFWIPEDVVMSFNKGKKFPVVVTIKDYTFRNTIASYDGKFAIGLNMEHRTKSGLKVGDKIEVDLEYDDKPRDVEIPKDMQKVLNSNPKVKEIFDALAYSHRKEYVRWIMEAKKEETRNARLEKLNQMILDKNNS